MSKSDSSPPEKEKTDSSGLHPMDFSREPKLFRVVVGSIGGQGGGAISEIMFNAVRIERQRNSGKQGLQGSYEKRSLTPGLAQRSGSVITSLSFLDTNLKAEELPNRIILSEMPHRASCDVIIAQEINELMKYIERAKPSAWVLANEDRSITPLEKMPDYIPTTNIDQQISAAKDYLKQGKYIGIDGNKILKDNELDPRSLNVVMLGMLSAAKVLPIQRKAYIEALALRFKEKVLELNIRAFEIGEEYYKEGRYKERDDKFSWINLTVDEIKQQSISTAIKHRRKRAARKLRDKIQSKLDKIIEIYPTNVAKYTMEGFAQLIDFQDIKYALWYQSLVNQIYKMDISENHRMTIEFARNMAGRIMQWDGPFRVAEYAYHEKIQSQNNSIKHMEKKLQPTLEEIVGMIPTINFIYKHPPKFLFNWYDKRKFRGRSTSIKTTGFFGFAFFWFLSKFKRIRRTTVRFRREKNLILQIMTDIEDIYQLDANLAEELCWYIGKIRGYSFIRHSHIQAYHKVVGGIKEIFATSGTKVALSFIKNVYTTISNAGQNEELIENMIIDHKEGKFVIPLMIQD